jgi:fibronectin-binding autotransporter adhesin
MFLKATEPNLRLSADSVRMLPPENYVEVPLGETDWIDETGDWFNPSNWSAGVPNAITGAFINNGGTAQITSQGAAASGVELGSGVQDMGTLSVSDSGNLQSDNSLYLARSGTGILNVTNGSVVSSGRFIMGENSGSNGTATISGSGSVWMNIAVCFVGFDGNATLNITSGGQLSNLNSTSIGENGGTGQVTVDGAGSSWDDDAQIDVGGSGSGTLRISNGAHVSNFNSSIGRNPGSNGLVNVSGSGSTWTNGGFLSVSDIGGDGTLHIVAGGSVSNSGGVLGTNGGTAEVTVEGTGSTWANDNDLIVGNTLGGVGVVTISDGAQVTSSNGFLGFDSPSTGTVEVDGVASTWTNSGNLYVGGSDSAAEGVGVLHIADGGTVNAASITVWDSGTLSGNGSVQATNGTTIEGTLAPEQTLSIASNVILSSTASTLSTVTPDAADNVVVEGAAILDGQLEVTVTGGPYTVGAQYTLLQANSGLNGTTFSDISVAFPPGVNGQVIYDTNHVYLAIDQAATPTPTPTATPTVSPTPTVTPTATPRPAPTPRSRPGPHSRPTPP